MENIEDENYSPYCKICTACGEDGCCPATMCTMEDGCEYKGTYHTELRDGYIFMKEFYEKIYNKLSDELKVEVDEIFYNI